MLLQILPNPGGDPETFDFLAKKMNAEGEIYVFEDALYAVKSAKEYGCKVIGIEDYSNEDDREEIKKIADFYAENYEQIKEYFEI